MSGRINDGPPPQVERCRRAMEQAHIPIRCLYCGDGLPGIWETLPLWGWCRACRVWWHFLRRQQGRHRQRSEGALAAHVGAPYSES